MNARQGWLDGRDVWVEPLDYERAVVVDAAGQRKRTRPLAGVNGEVCKEKRKKLWKERKKDLTRASIVRDGFSLQFLSPFAAIHHNSYDTRMALA